MTRDALDASVVVATRDRARRLEALLRSVAGQDGAAFEVVVVDNGSTDETAAVLECGAPGLALRVLHAPSASGPAAARNLGWRAAAGELVVFCDDDVEADPGWLAAFAEAHRRHPEAVLQGRTDPDAGELARAGAFNRTRRVTALSPSYPTCNIAYPRAALERLGGFREEFERAWAEDTDLGWRAREAGHDAVFVPEARVRHAVRQIGVAGCLREAGRLADTAAAARRHPGFRRSLHRGLFLYPEHERLLGALAGLALARRTRGASLALGLPYLLKRRRLHPGWAGALAALPGYALLDAVEIAALARGSIRHRTLVL
jgi:glycosyltransferase involved in cell wall biosynthesis